MSRSPQTEPELALECVRAYNDFLTEWCSPDPDRLLAQMALPLWDMDQSVKEIERAAKMGHKAVLMTHQPDGSFWFEDTSARRTLDLLADNLFYETDFPHPTGISPGPHAFCRDARTDIEKKFEGIAEDIIRKVLHDNAARVYHVD
ncbi:MAG: hypothetical protein V3V67_02015 [Myxococcota bacterium]